MSVQVIKVPDIGEGIAQVELVAWYVKPGDKVAEEQALADVMTDKATVEIPSPVAGQVIGLGGEVGQVLAVGSELIRIERDSMPSFAPDGATEGKPAVLGSTAMALPVLPSLDLDSAPAVAPASRRPPAPHEAPGASAARSASALRASADRPIASPSVRARAWELGIDLNDVQPTGPAGRILQADLDAYAAARPARTRPAGEVVAPGRTEEIRVIGLRRMIAQKMQESKRRIPHYTYVEEVDVTELERLRTHLNDQWGEKRGRLTLLPFLVQAIVLAIREFPHINARFDDAAGVLTRYDAIHVGIATQTDTGLMVPVLRDAHTRDLWASAAEIGRLAAAARSGRATREELTGSTLTITSLGRLGGIVSTPVINHPEVAIVGVNRIAERPVIVQGAVVARQLMNLSSSFDHRVIDGAMAAGFIQHVRATLERPAMLFVR